MKRSLEAILRGSATIVVMTILAAFFGFLLRAILTRKLTVEEFGLFYSILGFLAPIGLLKNLGMNKAIIKYLPEFGLSKCFTWMKDAFHWGLIASMLTSLMVVVPSFYFADFLGKELFHSQTAPFYFRIMLIYFISGTLVSVFTSFFQGLKKPFLLSFPAVFTAIFIFLIAFLYENINLKDLCIAYVVSEVTVLLICFIALLHIFPYFNIKSKLSTTVLKRLLSFGLKAMTSPLVSRIFSRLDIILLTYYQNLTQVGFYSAASPFSRLFMIFGSSVGKMMLPYSSEVFAGGKRRDLQNMMINLQRILLFVSIPIAVIFFLFSSQLLVMIFGSQYIAGSLVVRLLTIGTLLHCMNIVNTYVLIGIGKPLTVTKLTALSSLFNLAANIILIPFFGMNGAAMSTLLAYVIMFLASSLYMKSYIGQSFDFKILLRSTIPFSAMIIFLQVGTMFLPINNWIALLFLFLISLMSYTFLSVVAGFVHKSELEKGLQIIQSQLWMLIQKSK